MPLDATISGVDSNSYGTLEAADAYFAGRMYSEAWTGTDEAKEKALITATARLEALNYLGNRAVAAQALKHPRTGLFVDGIEVAANAIAPPMILAEFELALEMMKGETAASGTQLAGFKKLAVGPLTIEPNQPAATTDIESLLFANLSDLPTSVFRLIKDLITEGVGGGQDMLSTHFTLACGNRGQ